MKKRDLKLSPHNQANFDRLGAGERITGKELDSIRTNLLKLLNGVREVMYEERSAEHRTWTERQHLYTGQICAVLEAAHNQTVTQTVWVFLRRSLKISPRSEYQVPAKKEGKQSDNDPKN